MIQIHHTARSNILFYFYRLAFVDAMTKMEVDYNISKTGVERMRKEMFHLTQQLQEETVSIIQRRLGMCNTVYSDIMVLLIW